MKPDFDKMTLDELRDCVAFGPKATRKRIPHREEHPHNGSEFNADYDEVSVDGKVVWSGRDLLRHPIPDTFDAANAAMPEGWMWSKYPDRWQADYYPNWSPESHKASEAVVTTPDTGNKVRDLFCLVCKCRWAEKEAQQ